MKTVQTIFEEMAAFCERETGQSVGTMGDMAVRLYAVAAQVCGLYTQADWVGRQCFPQTADGSFLDQHAQLRGLWRRAAERAEGVIRFSVETALTADLVIPTGTVCMTAGLVRFETVEDAGLAAGTLTADVRARAVEPGRSGNAGAGTVVTMAVAPVGVKSCTNPEPFAGGSEAEGDGELRERVLETFRRLPNGANAAYYEQEALRFPGVAAAAVLPRQRGVGTVDVVVSTAAGLPGQELLGELADYFKERREIAVDVAVRAPTEKTVNVAMGIKAEEGRSFGEAKAAVEERIRSWFDGGRLGKDVLRAKLGELIFSTDGVENYALSAPAADIVAAKDELPRLGTLTVTALGGGGT